MVNLMVNGKSFTDVLFTLLLAKNI